MRRSEYIESEQVGEVKTDPALLERDLFFNPSFFNTEEQSFLIRSCLKKLDAADSPRSKRRRRALSLKPPSSDSPLAQFLPDHAYDFDQGHFDGVITHFREMHLTEWPPEDDERVAALLGRLDAVTPDVETQTHILHLASEGEILPHIDNVEASGAWILGVSLGSPRILRMQNASDDREVFHVLLPSGSVYIQRDELRFRYKHSILKGGSLRGQSVLVANGQRISIMIRDRIDC